MSGGQQTKPDTGSTQDLPVGDVSAPVQHQDALADPLLQHSLTDPLAGPPMVQFSGEPPPDDSPIQMKQGGTPVDGMRAVRGDYFATEKTGLFDLAHRSGRFRGAKDRIDKKQSVDQGDILKFYRAGQYEHAGKTFYRPVSRRLGGHGAIEMDKVAQLPPHKMDHAFQNDAWFIATRDTDLFAPVPKSVKPGSKDGSVARNTKVKVDTGHQAKDGGTLYYGMRHPDPDGDRRLIAAADLAPLADGQLDGEEQREREQTVNINAHYEDEERQALQGRFTPAVIREKGEFFKTHRNGRGKNGKKAAGKVSPGELIEVNYNALGTVDGQRCVAIKRMNSDGNFMRRAVYVHECLVGPMGEGMGDVGEDPEETQRKGWQKFLDRGEEGFGLLGLGTGGTSALKAGVRREHLQSEDEHGNVETATPSKTSTLGKYMKSTGVTDSIGGSVGMAKGIFGFAQSVRKMREGGKLDKFENALDLLESGSSTVSSFAWAVRRGVEHQDENGESGKWKHVSLVTGAITSAISSVKNTLLSVISLYKLYKDRDQSTQKGRRGAEIGAKLTSAVQSSLSTARSFLWALEKGVPMSLATSIPVVGVFVNAATAAIAFGTAWLARGRKKEMTTAEGDDKGEVARLLGVDEPTLESDFMVDDKRGVFGKRKKYKRFNPLLLARLAQHDWNDGDYQAKVAGERTRPITQEAYTAIKRYEFSSKMREINQKRQVKGNVKSGTALLSMAGDIASATGVGAVVGGAIKAALLAGTLVYKAGRLEQQRRRNKRGKRVQEAINGQIGEESTTTLEDFKNANNRTDKSTETKKKQYRKHARFVFEMVADLPDAQAMRDAPNGKARLGIKKKYDSAETYIKSTGVDVGLLYGKNGDPKGQYELVVKALESR